MKIKLESTDLSSRSRAAILRDKVSSHVAIGGQVEFNIESVISMSMSYADELFGILVKDFGIDIITSRISVIQARESVLQMISEAMHIRSTKQTN